ncbi:MAG TPA: ABC transporter ATP-binding protein [Verrucomicrobiae bacterium]
MSDAIIQVKGLGKKYLLHHQQEGRRYKALRDVIAGRAKSLFQSPKSKVQSPKSEEFWALRDVSFEVKRGDVVGIIGRNGAGKSTLLKLLSRITEPSKGSIRLRGRVASLLEVGTGFHPELTGRENIYLNGAILGMGRAEIAKKFDEIVAFAEVEKFLDTPVKRYSSGMYMRLAFAVAAHLEPEILIVDEVLAVGDAAFQKKCLGKMQDVSKGGRTVLFVSHNMAAVQQLCNQGILLEKGSIVAEGAASQVVQSYTSRSASRSESQVQLEGMGRHSWFDLRLRLTSFTVNDGRPLFHGESCEFTMEFAGSADFEEAWFGVGFSGLDGMRYATYDSYVARGMVAVKAGSKQTIRLQIDRLPLQPGIYLVDLGAALGSTSSPSDYLPGAVQVEVLPGEKTPSYLGNGICGVRLEGKWSLTP